MERTYKYMVCTRCFTYNHARYIEDAMRGFAMQEVNFPVVSVIVDDASTDGEADILKEWALNNLVPNGEKIWQEMPYGLLSVAHLQGKANQTFVIILLKVNHYQQGNGKQRYDYISEWYDQSKYHTMCEGDDYWIHPLKLQRQVDFMESHLDYSMCFHNALKTYEFLDNPPELFNSISKDQEISMEQMLDRWICPTPSILYRSSILPFFPVKSSIISGDWHIILHCAASGRVWGMKSVMACYRKTDSASSMSNTYSRRADEAFLKKVPILMGLDDYTGREYHAIINKYIDYYSDFGNLIRYKKEHGLFLTCLLRPITIIRIVWIHYLLPKFNKNAPTYSA